MRSCNCTRTRSPASLPIARRVAALTGSLCVPSPSAMNALSNGSPSTVPRTLTSPLVPKNAAEPSITTYVHAPLASPFRRRVENSVTMAASLEVDAVMHQGPAAGAGLIGSAEGEDADGGADRAERQDAEPFGPAVA